MNCSKCGNPLKPEAKFCAKCGTPCAAVAPEAAPQPAPQPKVQPQPTPAPAAPFGATATKTMPSLGSIQVAGKTFDLKKMLPFLIIGAVVVIAIVIGAIMLLSGGGSAPGVSIAPMDVFSVGEVSAIRLADGTVEELDGDIYSRSYSMDKQTLVFLCEEDGEDAKTLYVANGKEIVEISDEAYVYAMSPDGKTIAYLTERDDDDSYYTYELVLYKNGDETSVDDEVFGSYVAVSANGSHVSYCKRDDDELVSYIYDGKEPTEFEKDCLVMAMSNNMDYLYYMENKSNGDMELHVQRGLKSDTEEKIGDWDNGSSLVFNKDYSQIIFTEYGKSKSTLLINGKDEKKLDGIWRYGVQPRNSSTFSWLDYCTAYNVSSFANFLYWNNDGEIIRIDGAFETDRIMDDMEDYHLASNGKTLVYVTDKGEINRVDASKPKADSVELADEDAVSIYVSEDGKHIYFMNEDYEMYYVVGEDEVEEIGEKDSGTSAMVLKNKLFFVEDEELWVANGKEVGDVDGDFEGDVSDVYYTANGMKVICYDDGDCYQYFSADGVNFECIVED